MSLWSRLLVQLATTNTNHKLADWSDKWKHHFIGPIRKSVRKYMRKTGKTLMQIECNKTIGLRQAGGPGIHFVMLQVCKWENKLDRKINSVFWIELSELLHSLFRRWRRKIHCKNNLKTTISLTSSKYRLSLTDACFLLF